jgi:hypothetical protein
MMPVLDNLCLHCGANDQTGAFCEICGTALTKAAKKQHAHSTKLAKRSRRASKTLMWVALILSLIGGIGLIAALDVPSHSDLLARQREVIGAIMLLAGGMFWCLFIWSLTQPLPATIVGLTIYATFLVINVTMYMNPNSQAGINTNRPPPIGLLDIAIVAILARGVTAGIADRNLKNPGN